MPIDSTHRAVVWLVRTRSNLNQQRPRRGIEILLAVPDRSQVSSWKLDPDDDATDLVSYWLNWGFKIMSGKSLNQGNGPQLLLYVTNMNSCTFWVKLFRWWSLCLTESRLKVLGFKVLTGINNVAPYGQKLTSELKKAHLGSRLEADGFAAHSSFVRVLKPSHGYFTLLSTLFVC